MKTDPKQKVLKRLKGGGEEQKNLEMKIQKKEPKYLSYLLDQRLEKTAKSLFTAPIRKDDQQTKRERQKEPKKKEATKMAVAI